MFTGIATLAKQTPKAVKFITKGIEGTRGGVTPQYQNRIDFMKKWLKKPKKQNQYENLVKKFTTEEKILDNTYSKGKDLGKGSPTEQTARQNLRRLVRDHIPDEYETYKTFGIEKQKISGKKGKLKQQEETLYPNFKKTVQDAKKLSDEGMEPRAALLQSVTGEKDFNMNRLLKDSFPLYQDKLIREDPKAYKFLSNYINQDKAIDARLYGTDYAYFGDFTKGDNPLEYGIFNNPKIRKFLSDRGLKQLFQLHKLGPTTEGLKDKPFGMFNKYEYVE